MSVINQVLQDLERRRAQPAASGGLSAYVRPLPMSRYTRIPTWMTHIAAAIVIGALSGHAVSHWIAVDKRSLLTAPAVDHVSEAPVASATDTIAQDQVVLAVAKTEAAPTMLAEPSPPAFDIPVNELGVFEAHPPRRTVEAPASTVPAKSRAPRKAERARALESPVSQTASVPAPADDRAVQAPAPTTSVATPARIVPEPGIAAEARSSDVELRVSARQRAENEYRQAINLVSQGKNDDARVALARIVAEHPQHDNARHTLIGLLVSARKTGEAEALADERLARVPDHAGFAMISARIKFERADLAAALATLQRSGQAGQANAEYIAFTAAVLQRLGRHADAAEQYRNALRLNPGSGVWLMGLGISLQSLDRAAESREAFRRAREAPGLSPDLRAFVDQRIAQLER